MSQSSARFEERVNAILPKLRSEAFLRSKGLGNEIAFYVFDYPAAFELRMRQQLSVTVEKLAAGKPAVNARHVDLLDVLTDHLRARGYLDKAFAMQLKKGDDGLLKALKGPLNPTKFAKVFVEAARPDEHDVVLVSGIGSLFPVLRTHHLLNNLHPLIPDTPVVFFYPGDYTGKFFRLFGQLESKHYYRAFKLVD